MLRTSVVLVGVFTWALGGLGQAAEEPKSSATKVQPQAVEKSADKQPKPDEGADDAKSLQGEWHAVSAARNGKAIREDLTAFTVTFKGERISFLGELNNKYRLDTAKSPRELHMTYTEGKFKGETIRLFYSLEGGELKVCMPLGPKSARPTEFESKVGDGLLLLVLRRGPKDAAAEKIEDVAKIKRAWLRPDALPDGNYKLSFVNQENFREYTVCLFNLATKDEKQSASLVDASEQYEIKSVRTVISAVRPNGVHTRVVLVTPRGDLFFDGDLPRNSLEGRGCLQFPNGYITPAILSATDRTKMQYTVRDLSATSLEKALRLGRMVNSLRQRAEGEKNAKEKVRLVDEAALKEKEKLALVPRLYQEGFEKLPDHPLIFAAALDAARFAAKYQLSPQDLRGMIAKADKTAGSYGQVWQREFNLQIADALAPQKDYAVIALDIATRLEQELTPTDAAATWDRVLKALANAQDNTGKPAAAKETRALRLVKVEGILDREYRAKVPPFKSETFAGRKAKSDRAVVVELFTGTQCPPCVAAAVAFDALHTTYQPTDVVLIQYHLHIPGPDPLTNTDSEARWAYYGKSFPEEAIGVPTTLFNGKPQAGGGGAMEKAKEKYKEYRQVIDHLLETSSAAKLSASAVKQGNKINIKAEVTDLKNPGGAVRLRLLLVEETVRHVGGNRLRFHHNVVRSMIGGVDGFALNEKNNTHTATIDLEGLRTSLKDYLDDYNRNWLPFANSDRPLDLADLRLIALVQDDATREILQAASVKITAAK